MHKLKFSGRFVVFRAALLIFLPNALFSQVNDPLRYVNPFIGTANSDVLTKWGSEGGTYPGAVAPFGYIQITPETSISDKKGYYYQDRSIYFFSCLHHRSGYPNGSAGQLIVMPVKDIRQFRLRESVRPFVHQHEKAEAGYYQVLLKDDSTLVEAIATERTGIFRFTFPKGVTPAIFIGDVGEITIRSGNILEGKKWNALFHLGEDMDSWKELENGCILTFSPSNVHSKEIILKLSTSSVNIEGAQKNIDVEINSLTFDQLKDQVQAKWRSSLSVVEVEDNNEQNKTIFYTALYHSLLLPWIISDVDGKYRGRDGIVHKTTGKNEYGGFSPWDTYRTLHPLLCLLYPDRQKDMILSMLNVFQQTGYLPVEPMTGNHAVPIIVDSYLKGITGFDKTLAYEAMKQSIDNPPFIQQDLEVYQKEGYLSSAYSESVTRTVEYAYDDWALAQFSKSVMNNKDDYERLILRSHSYRNLFHPQEMFLLPRKENEFQLQPGTFGYKEGDKWVYSYAIPHQPGELVHLMGGEDAFIARLDSALSDQRILFDNETVAHVPYLFNYAANPGKTQEWVRRIMHLRYSNTPGGLPGNDDLGSMSSWYVWSAMGIFPLSPGQPLYEFGSPVFKSLTIRLENGRKFIIKSMDPSEQNIYIKSLWMNKKKYKQLQIPHAEILKGGEMLIAMDNKPGKWFAVNKYLKSTARPNFKIKGYSVSKKEVKPNELFWVRFVISNTGSLGTKSTRLLVNGQEYAIKNCLVDNKTNHLDSIACQLYTLGKASLKIDQTEEIEVEVVDPRLPVSAQLQVNDLILKPILQLGEVQLISYTAQNVGWEAGKFNCVILIDDSPVETDSIELNPGERKTIFQKIEIPNSAGFHVIQVEDKKGHFKVYHTNTEALLVDLSLPNKDGNIVKDSSGFDNHGKIIQTHPVHANKHQEYFKLGKDGYIEIPNSKSLEAGGNFITMMAWIYPTGDESADIFTQGDHHVFQVTGNKKLNFFAGGWGRGECSVDLPQSWINRWHHIAGVCDGNSLRVYIDGIMKGTTPLESPVDLAGSGNWNIGRNEEFPGERIFNGYMDKMKIFSAPLSATEIASIVKKEQRIIVKKIPPDGL